MQGKRKAEHVEADALIGEKPDWVVDTETKKLYELGVVDAMLPDDVKLTAETRAQLRRLREWAADEMERRRVAARLVLDVDAEAAPEPARAALVPMSACTQSRWGWGPESIDSTHMPWCVVNEQDECNRVCF